MRVQKRIGHFFFYKDAAKRRRSSTTTASEAVCKFVHSQAGVVTGEHVLQGKC